MILTKEERSQIRARADAATKGPWWKGSWSGQCFERHEHDRTKCRYKYSKRDSNCVSGPEENVQIIGYDDYGEILSSKDADFIAHSRQDIPALLDTCDALELERDLAIAHDTQPYPTAEAYESVFKIKNKLKEENAELKAENKKQLYTIDQCGKDLAEVRRCHAEIERLRAALEKIAKLKRPDHAR